MTPGALVADDPLTLILSFLSGAIFAVAKGFLWTYVLWGLYVLVMGLKRARDEGTLSPFTRALGIPILVAGYALDFAVNVAVLTPAFLELPRETTVTARLKRHKNADDWRGRISRWVAAHLLDPFDPDGRHI